MGTNSDPADPTLHGTAQVGAHMALDEGLVICRWSKAR